MSKKEVARGNTGIVNSHVNERATHG